MAEKSTKIDKIVENPGAKKIEAEKIQKAEQERTRIKKKLFLDYFKRLLGVISAACEGAEIDRQTFYNWKQEDPEFAKELAQIQAEECDEIEGRLKKGILHDQMRAITFWLEKRHPFYKPTVRIEEQVVGDKTLEDLIHEREEILKKLNEGTKKRNNKQGTDRGASVDPKQAGGGSPISGKPDPKNLLGKKDQKKPVAEAKAKGAK